jgi:hypothetical protein
MPVSGGNRSFVPRGLQLRSACGILNLISFNPHIAEKHGYGYIKSQLYVVIRFRLCMFKSRVLA